RAELESANPSSIREPASAQPATGSAEYRLLTFSPSGWPVLDESSDRYFAVWRADGSVIRSVGLPAGLTPDQIPLAHAAEPAADPLSPRNTNRQMIRTRDQAREIAVAGPSQTKILAGIKTERVSAEMRGLAWQLGIAGVIVLCIGLAGGWWVSSGLLQ